MTTFIQVMHRIAFYTIYLHKQIFAKSAQASQENASTKKMRVSFIDAYLFVVTIFHISLAESTVVSFAFHILKNYLWMLCAYTHVSFKMSALYS